MFYSYIRIFANPAHAGVSAGYMNVCICTSSFPINRKEVFHRYLEDIINILHARGHHVTILTQNKRGGKELFLPNVDVVWFPWKMTKKDVLAEVSFKTAGSILSAFFLIYNGIRYSKKIKKDKKIDIFLCLWIVPSGLFVCLAQLFGMGKKTPYLLWSLGSDVYNNKDNYFTRSLLRFIIRRSKAVFADGFELCDIIENISDRQCAFLPTFHKINSDESREPGVESRGDDSSQKGTVFLYIGRLSRVKGTDILVESLKLLNEDRQLNFKCYIIGDGELMPSLVNEVNRGNLDERVVFLGKITEEKIKAGYFNLADCIVIPSRSESIPVVLSEAVQYGKPMIVTNAGDMEYVVNKFHLGLVAEKENPAALADKMRKFIAQPITINQRDRKELLDSLLFENNAEKFLKAL